MVLITKGPIFLVSKRSWQPDKSEEQLYGVVQVYTSMNGSILTSLTSPATRSCSRSVCSPRALSRWMVTLVRRCYMRIQWRI